MRKLKINFATMCYHENGLRMPPQRMTETISLFENEGIEFLDLPQGCGLILRKDTNQNRAQEFET